ncbi:MAG: hypothetical protein JWM36_2845 [Hyphomicrobiales bacterium]|nr:hypothetical protein [Hyphomicrobiales bacterium]
MVRATIEGFAGFSARIVLTAINAARSSSSMREAWLTDDDAGTPGNSCPELHQARTCRLQPPPFTVAGRVGQPADGGSDTSLWLSHSLTSASCVTKKPGIFLSSAGAAPRGYLEASKSASGARDFWTRLKKGGCYGQPHHAIRSSGPYCSGGVASAVLRSNPTAG